MQSRRDGATLGIVKTPVIVAICVVGFAFSIVGPIVGYRMIFTSSFELSCMNRGAPAAFCECASEKTLERAGILDIFDADRMKVIAEGAIADCR